jgi:ParB family chromosome partitioning protein
MLTTKRYEYLNIDQIQVHPDVANHRNLDLRKVSHYAKDIFQNGLLEPLVCWEKKPGEYYLVGGFHRLAAIREIRKDHPGYFDRIDVRLVAGEVDEIRALNLKLNADRVDAKITDFFDAVIWLNNANWPREKIAEFLDKSPSWIAEIIRFVPVMPAKVRHMMEEGTVTWGRAKAVCKAIQEAPAGQERKVLERELAALARPEGIPKRVPKPLTLQSAKKRLIQHVEKHPKTTYTISAEDLLSLLMVIEGKGFEENHVNRVRKYFPGLIEA